MPKVLPPTAACGGTVTTTSRGRFPPKMDLPTSASFGQWGPRIAYVPQIYLVDKNGAVQGQFMGTDSLFVGDQRANLRASINHLIGLGGASKQSPPAAKKK